MSEPDWEKIADDLAAMMVFVEFAGLVHWHPRTLQGYTEAKKQAYAKTQKRDNGGWCNGSTGGFEPLSQGSSPCPPANDTLTSPTQERERHDNEPRRMQEAIPQASNDSRLCRSCPYRGVSS